MSIKNKLKQDTSQARVQDIVWYVSVFLCGVIGAFLVVIILSKVGKTQEYERFVSKSDFFSELALWDDEKGEILEFVEINANQQIEKNSENAGEILQDVRVRDDLGKIRFLGQINWKRGILSGDILLKKDELNSFAIVNKSSNQYYFLSEDTTTIQTGEYYIVLNACNISSKDQEFRIKITAFFCPMLDLK